MVVAVMVVVICPAEMRTPQACVATVRRRGCLAGVGRCVDDARSAVIIFRPDAPHDQLMNDRISSDDLRHSKSHWSAFEIKI